MCGILISEWEVIEDLEYYSIPCVQLRTECLLECVRVAPVPWSAGTQAACELGLSLNTFLRSPLEDQKNMVGLKLVLRHYSLHMVNIDDPRSAKVRLGWRWT